MNDTESLEVVWAAINCMVNPSDIMHAIEKRVGRKALNARWSRYFDAEEGTEPAIKKDLKAMARSSKRVQPTSTVRKSTKSKRG